jgi:NhaC family Na+:H+ antiporter
MPSETAQRPRGEISLGLALLPLLALVAGFAVGAAVLGVGVEMLIVAMLAAAAVAGFIAVRRGADWAAIERSTGEKFAAVLPVVLILLAIGALIGSWVLSGTIPLLISWGIQLINPRFLALTAFLVTAAMSLCTGTSWGSAGTLGVALMGAAVALGAPLPVIAGAVVSGAYFGDKMSPLSDSTNICALAAGADLYAHIRHMLYTAGPSMLIALVLYTVVGLGSTGGGAQPAAAGALLSEIGAVFSPGLLALLPLVVVLIGIAARTPPVLALAGSSLVALLVGVVQQGFAVRSALIAAVQGFDVGMVADLGLDPAVLSPIFVRLLNRGGLYSMAPTLVVILAAFLLAAGLDVSGALQRILDALLSTVRSTFGLIAAAMTAGAVMISLTSHGGVTALVVGGMFQDAFRRRELAPENLSRSLEDSVTVVEPLLPWTVSAIFMATTLGVPTLRYLPWAAFCFGGPLFSLLWAALAKRSGFGIRMLPAQGGGAERG